MPLIESAEISVPNSRFQSFEHATVITKRNLGMNRLRSSPNIAFLNTKPAPESSVINPNKGSVVVFGQGGIGDKSSNIWNWPLGNATVTSEEKTFEVILDIKPFMPAEVSAKVLGNELQIHCKSAESKKVKMREITRCYQLPLNVDPKSVQFEILPGSRQLVVFLLKSLPIKLAVADYTVYSDEGSDSDLSD